VIATIVTNFKEEKQRWSAPPDVLASLKDGKMMLANYNVQEENADSVIHLRPYESFVLLEDASRILTS
jgi:hypothetical protein